MELETKINEFGKAFSYRICNCDDVNYKPKFQDIVHFSLS